MALLTGEGFRAEHRQTSFTSSPLPSAHPTNQGYVLQGEIVQGHLFLRRIFNTLQPSHIFSTVTLQLGRTEAKLWASKCRSLTSGFMLDIVSPNINSCPTKSCGTSWQNQFYSLSCNCFTGNSVSQSFWSHCWLTSHLIAKHVTGNATQAGWFCRKAVNSFP